VETTFNIDFLTNGINYVWDTVEKLNGEILTICLDFISSKKTRIHITAKGLLQILETQTSPTITIETSGSADFPFEISTVIDGICLFGLTSNISDFNKYIGDNSELIRLTESYEQIAKEIKVAQKARKYGK
jgi:hypothetical protein